MSGSTSPKAVGPAEPNSPEWGGTDGTISVVVAVRSIPGLGDELHRLAAALESLDLRGAPALGKDTDEVRDRLVTTIRSYLLPRVENPESPFLVVVAGPTGSGKSTIVNSLAGLDLAATGPLRPTTRSPLVLASEDPGEETVRIGGIECRVAVGKAPILQMMSLVDTPDVDSMAAGHREMAEALVDQADVVIFVTSALRYADDVPWEVLRRARSRGAVVIPVINRVGPDGGAAVHDFGRRLGDAGLDDNPVRIPEHHLGSGALRVPSLAVRELRKRLYWIAKGRAKHQAEVINRVLNSTGNQIRALVSSVATLAAELDSIEASAIAGVLGVSDVPARSRPWAAFPLPAIPDSRRRLRRWMRKSEPKETEFSVWERQIEGRLVAEIHTRIIEAVTVHGGAVRSLNPEALQSFVPDSRSMIELAVRGWLADVRTGSAGSAHPRLVAAVLASSVLTGSEEFTPVLGPDHRERVEQHRLALQETVGVVFEHFAGRLAEAWRLDVGDPSISDVTERLSAVLTAYQFADA
jgi:energy-coupling factor transporter ATP-binding protein EcfA2